MLGSYAAVVPGVYMDSGGQAQIQHVNVNSVTLGQGPSYPHLKIHWTPNRCHPRMALAQITRKKNLLS